MARTKRRAGRSAAPGEELSSGLVDEVPASPPAAAGAAASDDDAGADATGASPSTRNERDPRGDANAYEKAREQRIVHNKAIMDALGVSG